MKVAIIFIFDFPLVKQKWCPSTIIMIIVPCWCINNIAMLVYKYQLVDMLLKMLAIHEIFCWHSELSEAFSRASEMPMCALHRMWLHQGTGSQTLFWRCQVYILNSGSLKSFFCCFFPNGKKKDNSLSPVLHKSLY